MKIIQRYLLSFIVISLSLAPLAPFAFGDYGDLDQEIETLNLQIQSQKRQIDSIKSKQEEYKIKIREKQADQITLKNQLSTIEDRLEKINLDIEEIGLEISKTALEINKVETDSRNLDNKIEKQKQHIASILSSMHRRDQISTLEMLLLNDSLAEFLNEVKYLEDTNEELEKSVNSLKNDKEKLEDNKAILSKKSEEMTQLKNELQDQKDSLAYEHENKDYLLKETKSSEQQYQALLQKAQREQRQAENDIYNAEQSIREKMSAKERAKLDNGNNTIAWPVAKNVIVAKFHDQDYPYRKLIGEHPAVDIRAKQGSTLMAAADGYVAKVKFDGTTSYAYIMIVHGNGLATVYGHVSAVYVMPGQYVSQGQKIGLSGGMPGGIGSGPFTTGPHLHFEVRLNGLPVDPELYLP